MLAAVHKKLIYYLKVAGQAVKYHIVIDNICHLSVKIQHSNCNINSLLHIDVKRNPYNTAAPTTLLSACTCMKFHTVSTYGSVIIQRKTGL